MEANEDATMDEPNEPNEVREEEEKDKECELSSVSSCRDAEATSAPAAHDTTLVNIAPVSVPVPAPAMAPVHEPALVLVPSHNHAPSAVPYCTLHCQILYILKIYIFVCIHATSFSPALKSSAEDLTLPVTCLWDVDSLTPPPGSQLSPTPFPPLIPLGQLSRSRVLPMFFPPLPSP